MYIGKKYLTKYIGILLFIFTTNSSYGIYHQETEKYNIHLLLLQNMQTKNYITEQWPAININDNKNESYVSLNNIINNNKIELKSDKLDEAINKILYHKNYKIVTNISWQIDLTENEKIKYHYISPNQYTFNIENTYNNIVPITKIWLTMKKNKFFSLDLDVILNTLVDRKNENKPVLYPQNNIEQQNLANILLKSFRLHSIFKMHENSIYYVDHPIISALIYVNKEINS